jgi:RHS repeat-associated protein
MHSALSVAYPHRRYYYRNRLYSAQLGRFVSRDPLLYAGSKWNLYEYVRGMPTVSTDPKGLVQTIMDHPSEARAIGKSTQTYDFLGESWDREQLPNSNIQGAPLSLETKGLLA